MTLKRMDNVLIVVEDLEAAKAFFTELGMELEGEATNEGPWVDRIIGLDDVVANRHDADPGRPRPGSMRSLQAPAVRAEPENAPTNTLGLRRIMFAVEDVDDVVARRDPRRRALGEIAQYEDVYRLCFLRAPEGSVIGWPSSPTEPRARDATSPA